jgi:hypothetical protein
VVAKVAGRLFPLGDAEALARCLIDLAANAEAGCPEEVLRQRLEAHFSFEAGRAAFWQLAWIREFIAAPNGIAKEFSA